MKETDKSKMRSYSQKLSNRALSFENNSEKYDQFRPSYPQELFDYLAETIASGTGPFLEVGAGTGQASQLIIETWPRSLTAIEPGTELHALLKTKFKNNHRIRTSWTSFEAYNSSQKYSVIFAGSSWHWPALSKKYRKAAQLLEKDGKLILFWNNYSRDSSPLFDEIQSIFDTFHPRDFLSTDLREIQRQRIEFRKKEVEESNLFSIIDTNVFHWELERTTESYLGLLQTFSKNHEYPPKKMANFYQNMENLLNKKDGTVTIPVITDLIIAEKI